MNISAYTSYLKEEILTGLITHAEYKEQVIIDYRHNPFIEALPNILSPQEAKGKLRFWPYYSPDERNQEPHLKLHYVERVKDLVEPLSDFIDLEQRFSRMIRHGYTSKSRNPMTPHYIKILNTGAEAIKKHDLSYFSKYTHDRTTASGFAIIGMSGMGKSTCVNSILLQYPQLIKHSSYKGTKINLNQVVWLKIDCPYDGGIKGLCLKFFDSLDKLLSNGGIYLSKFGKLTTEAMIPRIAQLSLLHGLGVLVIDEIQNISLAKSGGSQKMLNFFVELVNCIGIPVILIGTGNALAPLTTGFSNARRSTGEGDKTWYPMSNDDEWENFVQTLWTYQWTQIDSPLTKKIIDVLYEESCGIIDIAIKLFILAQWRAITTGIECIKINIIRSVAKDSLSMVQPALKLIRQGNIHKLLAEYTDIMISKEKMEELLNKYKEEQRAKSYKLNKKSTKPMDPHEILITKISSWLISGGVDRDTSLISAKEALTKHSIDADISKLNNTAFLIAQETLNSRNVSQDRALKTPKKSQKKSELLETLTAAQENNRDIAELLKEQNIIKDALELT